MKVLRCSPSVMFYEVPSILFVVNTEKKGCKATAPSHQPYDDLITLVVGG